MNARIAIQWAIFLAVAAVLGYAVVKVANGWAGWGVFGVIVAAALGGAIAVWNREDPQMSKKRTFTRGSGSQWERDDHRSRHRRLGDGAESRRLRHGHGGALQGEAPDRERVQAGLRGPHPQGARGGPAGGQVVDQPHRGGRRDPARRRGAGGRAGA